MTTAPNGVRESFLLVTLDGFSLRRRSPADGVEWVDSGLGEKSCVLLAFLALVHTPVPRHLLCDLLWEEADGGRARNSLRQSLFRIRRVVGERAIFETPEGVLLGRGVIAVDLLRAIEGQNGTVPLAEVSAQLAESFGHTTRPIGTVFEDWRGRVRRQLIQGEHRAVLPMHLDETLASTRGVFSSGGTEPPARQRLEQLYRLSSHGIPVSVWFTGRPESDLRQAVDSFGQACRAQGACVASVHRRPGVGYSRSALERDLAEVIWPLPGAAGIKPEHHLTLDRVMKGMSVEHGILRSAILDLVTAVAENAPLVITMGDPGRYSLGALSSLVSDLAALRDRAVMLLVAEHSGVRPVHSLCIEVPLAGTVAPAPVPQRVRASRAAEGAEQRPSH
jgi:hypothetical protein